MASYLTGIEASTRASCCWSLGKVFCYDARMRRFAVSGFVLFYAVLALSGSANRLSTWIDQHTGALHEATTFSVHPSKVHDSNSDSHQRRITEEHYVVEPYLRASEITLVVQSHFLAFNSATACTRSISIVSSRAPPSFA